MAAEPVAVRMIGFEEDGGLTDLLESLEIRDYKGLLPGHLADVLRKQEPDVVVLSIELLKRPSCNLGGTKQSLDGRRINVQDLRVPLDLRISVRCRGQRVLLDVEFVLRYEDLDGARRFVSDMFVKNQRVLES